VSNIFFNRDGKAGQLNQFWPAPRFGPQSAGRVDPPHSLILGSLFWPAFMMSEIFFLLS